MFAAADTPAMGGTLVFLVDGRTRRNGEWLAHHARRHRLGTLVGSPTAGDLHDPEPMHLPTGHEVSIAISWPLDPADRPFVPVQPHIRVAPTIAGVRAGRDEVLDRALDVIRGTKKK
jgi:C-terminal processing protease CtpA/Prc